MKLSIHANFFVIYESVQDIRIKKTWVELAQNLHMPVTNFYEFVVIFCCCVWNLCTASWDPLSKNYRKFPTYSDTKNICCNHSKIWTMWLYHRVMSPNDAAGMANSVDPDQTAPLGAVWSGSALFAQAYLSENLRSLRYLESDWIVLNVDWWS